MSWINWYYGIEDSKISKRRRLDEDRILEETWKRTHMTVDESKLLPPDYDETREKADIDISLDVSLISESPAEIPTAERQSRKVGRPQKTRISIPKTIKIRLIRERGGLCEQCNNEAYQQIHHIDENPTNNNPDNLMLVCYECHKRFKRKKDFEAPDHG